MGLGKLMDLLGSKWRRVLSSSCVNCSGAFFETEFCPNPGPPPEPRRYRFELSPGGELKFVFTQGNQKPLTVIHSIEKNTLIITGSQAQMFELSGDALYNSGLNLALLSQARECVQEGLLSIPANDYLQDLVARIQSLLGDRPLNHS